MKGDMKEDDLQTVPTVGMNSIPYYQCWLSSGYYKFPQSNH